jgi:hypothetical protein
MRASILFVEKREEKVSVHTRPAGQRGWSARQQEPTHW